MEIRGSAACLEFDGGFDANRKQVVLQGDAESRRGGGSEEENEDEETENEEEEEEEEEEVVEVVASNGHGWHCHTFLFYLQ